MADEEKKTGDASEKEVKEEVKPARTTDDAQSDGEKKNEARQDDEVGQVEVPKEFKALIEQIEKMSVMELNELVKVLEKKFGVSAQAVAVTASSQTAGGDSGGEEKDSFVVELKDSGSQKIAIIKVVKEVLGLGLKEAKDLVDSAPAVLKEGVKREEADEIKKKVEEAGGSVELK